MKFIVDLWLDSYNTEAEERTACAKHIKDVLSSENNLVTVEPYAEPTISRDVIVKSFNDWFDHFRWNYQSGDMTIKNLFLSVWREAWKSGYLQHYRK